VQVSDGQGGTDTQAIAVTVANTNEAPTDLSLSANSVAENATTGTVVGTISGIDVDMGDTKTYSLTDTAGGRFAIDSATGQLTVADGNLLNYESATSHSVTVRVTDAGGLIYDETFTINLTNVNEAPTGADATVTISEDTSHTLTTANFGFSDVDTGDSLSVVRIDTLPTAGSLTLSGVAVTAGQVIAVSDITGGHLVFTPTADANGTSYASVTFSVGDSTNAYDTAPNTLTFNVTATNDAPTDLSLSANTVAENATTGTVVGTVTGTDVDAGDTKTYSLTDTAGGRFVINASTGEITVADGSLLNHENAASHSLTVQVTDSGGQSYTETFTINLTNVTEAPTGVDATDAPTEDTANILTTVNFGMRETNRIPNAPSSGLSSLIESEAEGLRLPDGLQKTIEIKTEAPLTADILAPRRNGPSAVSEKLSENVIATRETSQLAHPNENRGSDALRDSMLAQGAAVAEANRKDFLEPDDPIDPIETADESTVLKRSATMVLASVALQNGLGTNTKLRRLFSHPAGASNVSPNPTPQQSADDNGTSNPNGSEHSRSTAEDADHADP
jgi:VCBS repeat-containing protein